MSHRKFIEKQPRVGGTLAGNAFGKLVATYESVSPIPLRGGRDTGRHVYLALKVPNGPNAGIFECAVNIRSDEGTEVLYAHRIEDSPAKPATGFTPGVHLAYGSGNAAETDYLGLKNDDFVAIENDALYDLVRDLAGGADLVEVYGVTYAEGDGIHDVHMNSGTEDGDAHKKDDRDRQDGAIAFHVTQAAGGDTKTSTHWVLVRFESQTIEPAAL
jgi:hypothetical protein